ncbi:MAG: hypothetical protein PHI64_06380 [Zoogloea sp.]|uniref:hypothetical protein n=1 Tax=Zoogloea sp. TaxID=49181 RepID=UPI00262A31BD|nr:hypothetical protein [Zoogloea sp.]MDD2988575.1 hypothetical protein [Zoogloea sp.]
MVHNAHPLLHPDTLGKTLTEIATNAAPTAIIELIRWLDSFHYEAELSVSELARLVVILDEAAQPQLRQAAGLYLSNAFGSRSVRYKALGRDFYASLGRAYDLVLGGLLLDTALSPATGLHTEILLRTVRSAAGEMKWAAFDYQGLAPEVWLRAGGAFRTASASGALNTPVSIREGRETRSTISREFVRLVALQCASLDQLSPERIEATDKLVRYLQHSLELSSEPAPGGLFSIDLETLAPPRRCLSLPEVPSTALRFFRPADAVPMLEELQQTLIEAPGAPAFAGLSLPSVTASIRHLSRQWGAQPPMRQYRRHQVQGQLALATGLGFIRSLLSGDAQLRPAAAWTLMDASRNGFGVSSSMMDPEVCRVGALVGAHVGETGRWVLALVRRVRSCDQAGVSVGLQTISSDPQHVVLDDGSRSWSGILCDPVVRGRTVRVACEPGFMRVEGQVFARLGARMVKLEPGRMLMGGPGYQIIVCQVP